MLQNPLMCGSGQAGQLNLNTVMTNIVTNLGGQRVRMSVVIGYEDNMPMFERGLPWSEDTRCYELPYGARLLICSSILLTASSTSL